MGFKHRKIEDILEKSATFGTIAHSHLRSIVDPNCGETPIQPIDPIDEFRILQLKSKFCRYMSQYPYDTIYTEKTLISPKLGYGGTLDWYAKMSGFKILNDFKTSKKLQVTMLFQLGGYYNLLRETLQEEPDGASIILINDKMCRMNLFNKDQLMLYGEIFQKLAEFYTLSQGVSAIPDAEMFQKLTIG